MCGVNVGVCAWCALCVCMHISVCVCVHCVFARVLFPNCEIVQCCVYVVSVSGCVCLLGVHCVCERISVCVCASVVWVGPFVTDFVCAICHTSCVC